MVYATAVFKVDSQQRDAVVAAMTEWSKVARQLPGCLSHAFYADLEDGNSIRFYGEWESVEARQTAAAHLRSSAFGELMYTSGIKTENSGVYTAIAHS